MTKVERVTLPRPARLLLAVWMMALTTWTGACTEAPTQIVVVIDPDPGVQTRLTAVQVVLRRNGEARSFDAGHYAIPQHLLQTSPQDGHLVLRPGDPADTRSIVVTVTGTLSDGARVSYALATRFERGKTLYLHAPLVSACARVTGCPEGTTCREGNCEAIVERRLTETPPTPRMDAATNDVAAMDRASEDVPDTRSDGGENITTTEDIADVVDAALDANPVEIVDAAFDVDVTTNTDAALDTNLAEITDTTPDIFGETGPLTLPESCADLHRRSPSLPDGTYRIDLDGAGPREPFDVYCDMVTAMGGWTLAVRIRGNSAAHHTTSAVGRVISPTQMEAAKLSDVDINLLRGDLSSSVMYFECQECRVYFQENRPFDATSSAGALMRCSASASGPWSMAMAYPIHYGLNTYMAPACHYAIYSYDVSGCYCGIRPAATLLDGVLWVR